MKNCEPTEFGSSVRAIATVAAAVRGRHRLVLDRVAGPAAAGPVRVATLDDEAAGHAPVEHDAVVEAALGERHEVAGGDRRQVGLDLDGDRALGRIERDGPRLAGRQGRRLRRSGIAPPARRRRRWLAALGAGRPMHDAVATTARRAARRVGAGEGSCGGLQGGGKVDGAGEERLTEDDAGCAGLAQSTETVEVADPAGDEDLGIVRPNERSHPLVIGLCAAVGQHEARHAGADELAEQLFDRRRRRTPPRDRRPGAPVAGRARPPASHRRRRGTPADRRGGRRSPSSGRRGSRRPRTRAGSPPASRARRRAAAAPPTATPPRRPSRGWPGCRRRAPSKSTRWTSRAPWATTRSTMRSGRSVGAPTPVDAPGQ